MVAFHSSTKIWRGTLLLVLLACEKWCDLRRSTDLMVTFTSGSSARSAPRSQTQRLARRKPPSAKQGGRRPVVPRLRQSRQLPLQRLRPVPLHGVIKKTSKDETFVQLHWQTEGTLQPSPFTGLLKQAPGALRLQEGSEVLVHVLPVGERLTLRLAENSPPGNPAIFRRLPRSKDVADSPRIEWSPKQGRSDYLNWMDAKPLPHVLNGGAAPHVQGQVMSVNPSMALVRLFWDPPAGLSDPELSPITAVLPAEAVQRCFGLATLAKCYDYLQEGQLVSVQLQDIDVDGEDRPIVALSSSQPMPARPPVAGLGYAAPKLWQPLCSRDAPCRAADVSEAAWQATPAETAAAIERQFGHLNLWRLQTQSELATTAFAVTGAKQDLVITGAIPRVERLSLLALLIAQHLAQAAPHERVMLVAPYAENRLRDLIERSKDELVREHLAKVRAQTLAGFAHDILQDLRNGQADARAVSLVVVEGLPSDDRGQSTLKELLSILPSRRRWGPTILWNRDPVALKVMEAALTASPARLQTANALHGAQEQVRLVPESLAAAAKMVAQRVARRQTVAVFTNRLAKMRSEIEKLVPDHSLNQARLRILNNADEWRRSDGIFDVVIHVDPPPKPAQYFQRLESCRVVAIVFIDVTKYRNDGERLDNNWVEFANYAQDVATGEDLWRLRGLCRHEHHGTKRLSKSFQKDFHAKNRKELVWTAGVAETDTELIFDAGI